MPIRCIFTENSISLSQYWRQWGSRYAIHAGRNLPDKGFRYLRTVMVTAAVCWDLFRLAAKINLQLPASSISTGQASDPILHFTILQSPVFLVNSRSPLFCYTPRKLPSKEYPFSRSYGVNLPSSFSIVLSIALVCSTSLPESVLSTVYYSFSFFLR